MLSSAPDCEFVTGIIRRRDNHRAVARRHDLLDSLTSEQTMLSLWQRDLERSDTGFKRPDGGCDSLDDANDSFSVPANGYLPFSFVAGELNITAFSSCEEVSAACHDEGKDVCGD